MSLEETSEDRYQTLIDILADMVKVYLNSQPKPKGGEKKNESNNEFI
ncbi:hypothetical protein [Bacillus thuringiensis]|nr:hypothetical protein [Bacillus thuringiensis]